MPRLEHEIKAIVELLKPGPDSEAHKRPERYGEAIERAGRFLDASAPDHLALLMAMIDANVHDTTVALDLVSFLEEDDMRGLVQKLLNGVPPSDGGECLLDHVALQRPDLVSREHVEGMTDYRLWGMEGDALTPPPTFHLVFEQGSLVSRISIMHDRHPTWRLPTEGLSYRLGGPGFGRCPSCEQSLIHLVTLDDAIDALMISLPKLVLETCPTCWSPAYYQHDQNGRPTRIAPIEIEGHRWDNVPLQEQRVRIAKTPTRWLRQAWAHSNGRQNLNRLGGLPSWIQYPDVPNVPQTERKMKLLLQLDSDLPLVGGGKMLWGSGGLLYVFWDAETRISCHFGQWT